MLVSAMHITAGVFVNDDESGLHADIWEWLEKLAPFREDYRHHRTGEDNGDAHLKSMLVHHEVIVPDHEGAARPRAVAARLLRGVRRAARQAAHREGDGRVRRASAPLACALSAACGASGGAGAGRRPADGRADDRAGAGARRRSSRRRRTRPSGGWRRPTRGSRRARTRPGPDEVLERIGMDAVLAEDTAAVIRGTSLDLFAFRARAHALDEAAKALAACPGPAARGGAAGQRAGEAAARAGAAGAAHRRGARARRTRRRSSGTRRGSSCAGLVSTWTPPARPQDVQERDVCGRAAPAGDSRLAARAAPRRGPPDPRRGALPARAAARADGVPARRGGASRRCAWRSTRTCARCRSCGTPSGWRRAAKVHLGVDARHGGAAGAARAARGAAARSGGAGAGGGRGRRAARDRGPGARAAAGGAAVPVGAGHAGAGDGAAAGARGRLRGAPRADRGGGARGGPGRAARRRAALARGRRPGTAGAHRAALAPGGRRRRRRSSDARGSARSSCSAVALAAEILYGADGTVAERLAAWRALGEAPLDVVARETLARGYAVAASAGAPRRRSSTSMSATLYVGALSFSLRVDDLGDRVVDASSSCRAPSSRRSRRPPARR